MRPCQSHRLAPAWHLRPAASRRASKLREIHVLADGNAEPRAEDQAYDIFVTRLETRLEARHQMLLGVIGDQFARRRLLNKENGCDKNGTLGGNRAADLYRILIRPRFSPHWPFGFGRRGDCTCLPSVVSKNCASRLR